MTVESPEHANKEFTRAMKELEEGNVLAALACLEKALTYSNNPSWYSYLGYCIAKERGHVSRGLDMCAAAIQHEPYNSAHYLYLGKTHLIASNKVEAIHALRQAIKKGDPLEAVSLLNTIGVRKLPVIPFISRDNPINKYLGKLLKQLGLR